MNDFQNEIYGWFSTHKRDLPWRKTSSPYPIWLSEIILQQTRVVQGTSYYNRFIEKFPTLADLANASENEVLKLWQGLGYYSRARNLHLTAKIIVNEYNGEFPSEYDKIIKLKGIGPYTAAAISSIAFNLSYPVVDGNIYRVFSRYFGIATPIDSNKGKKEFLAIAEELMSQTKPGLHNQALMEFGALQCVPKSPKCEFCPVVTSCFAYNHNQIQNLPVKSKKVKQSNRYFYFYYFDSGKFTYLEKREENDIWKNLYQFPLKETNKQLSEMEILKAGNPFDINGIANIKAISPIKKHILSHQLLFAQLVHIEIDSNENLSKQFLRVNKKDIFKFAVPRLLEQFIEQLKIE